MARDPLNVWWLGDGKPGHENQSLGLAEGLDRLTPCDIRRISVEGQGGPIARTRAAARTTASMPAPDLILAAGHATHLPLLYLSRKFSCRSVVLMRPSLPLSWFDLCIVPEHDFPKSAAPPKVLLTRGAPNRIVAGHGGTGKIFLIGGPSRTHGWQPDELLGAIAEIAAGGGWELADSRRTPEPFLRQIESRLPEIAVFPHQETGPGWLPGKLSAAAEIWVTEDSVSMIYEALGSGARVGILPLPCTDPDSRVIRGLDKLIADGFLTPFPTWQKSRELFPPPEILREADRCAALLLATIRP